MIIRITLIVLIISSFLLSIDSPIFIFGDNKEIKGATLKKQLKYKIYKINPDGSLGNLIVDETKFYKGRFSKNKINFDFSKANYRVEFYLRDDNIKYSISLDMKKAWFSTKYKGKKKPLKVKNLPPNILLTDDKYPYKFNVKLKRKNPILRGYVFTRDENNYTKPVDGAIIRLQANTNKYRNKRVGSPFDKTSSDGSFEWEVGFNDTLSFTPSIVITKPGFHLESIHYKKEDINNALKTGKSEIFLHKRLSPRNNPHIWKDCQSISEYLTYNPQCDDCVCQDSNERYYHKMGMCDIRSCNGDSTLVFRNNFGRGTDEIIFGEMKGICELTPPPPEAQKIITENYKNVLASLQIYLNEKPVSNAQIKYTNYKDENGNIKLLGKTNNSGKLFMNEYKYIYNREELDVDTALFDLGLSLNSDNYFFLRKTEFKKKKPHKFIVQIDGEEFSFKIRHKINNSELWSMDCADIKVFIDKDKGNTFYVEEKKNQNINQLIIEHAKTNSIKGQESYDQCWQSYSSIDSLVEACEWDQIYNIIDSVVEDCNIGKNDNVLLNIIHSLYYRILEFNDNQFIDELFYRTGYLNAPTFSIIDALYERYDEITKSVRSNLSNYEIAHHYFRKFHFYFLYAEYLQINQSIIESDDGRPPTIWVYDFGFSEDGVNNFRELVDAEAYTHIRKRSLEALGQFKLIKDKAAKTKEKLGNFHELDLMEKNLEVILDEWRLLRD